MLLDTPINALPKTSPLTIKRFKSLGIDTYFDLIQYIPYRYEDYSLITSINALQEGERVTIKGIVTAATNAYTQRGFKLQKIVIEDNSGKITVTWINQPYIIHIFKENTTVAVSGDVALFAGNITIQPKEWEVVKDNVLVHTGRIIPIYSETYGLSTKTIREKIFHVISHLKNVQEPQEIIPRKVIVFNGLMSLREAYISLHSPTSTDNYMHARKRLAFDELFMLQLSNAVIKSSWSKMKVKHPLSIDKKKELLLHSFINHLPFLLTPDQLKAFNEIKNDVLKPEPMNRFLQGDVGSGKTVVAALSAYLVYLNRKKTLFMAPTEILAIQHFQTLKRIFEHTEVTIGLYTGSHKETTQKDTHIVIGTQALLNKIKWNADVELIVIDEQHRFGVEQRARLRSLSNNPHVLTMTATPIPRTLALTLYGQLDLSVITQLPQGRLPIKTFFVPVEKRLKAYEWIKNKIHTEHAQVFIICPLVEESETETLQTVKAAKKEFERLQKDIFRNERVALLHGKLKSVDKNTIMSDFAAKKYDILVATSVVEVGIDIQNATIMIIEGSERFGLAQLHQLRGRVGRGEKQSYCYLFSEARDEIILKRLHFFCHTTSGNDLAEYDLKSRGAGNIFGVQQHGYLKLKIASLSDINLIKQTKQAVSYVLKESPDLKLYSSLLTAITTLTVPKQSIAND